ncbi:translation initiation factor IF-2 [Spongiactinospora rosea]|uniref:Translation initiation factor IF-2 n=1 Tax=Spongiactinospora rosea TaxID=2248750 RepID=A0A366LWY9_9ACTN|nr:translation initiation factor IF-2 [Spongiactinospora rosea]
MTDGWLSVPVGAEAERWNTVAARRTVLGVARNMAAASRLLDIVPLFRSDPRVQVVFTVAGGSAFGDPVADYLRDVQARTIPWEQAVATRFDLAIAPSANGRLDRLRAPVLLTPHGAGHNRRLTGPDGGDLGTSGLSAAQLVRDGRVVPAAIALPHADQLTRLARDCPQALPRAVITGDPCFDRIAANAVRRDRHRRALGVGERKLIFVSSTWGRHALLAPGGGLVTRLLAELPLDEYAVALAAHPNVWYGHGGLQLRLWLAEAREAGLILIPPHAGWQGALIAADAVVGDHGSVTFYGAALGRPALLASSGAELDELDPSSPTAELCRVLPRLDPRRGLLPQIEALMSGHVPTAYDAVTIRSVGQGGGGERLRRLAYDLMDFPPPGPAVPVTPLPEPAPEQVVRPGALLVTAAVEPDGVIALRRYPAAPPRDPSAGEPPDAHLITWADELDRRILETAAIIMRDGDAPGWADEVLRRHPGCFMAAALTGPNTATLTFRRGDRLHATASPGLNAGHLPSAVYAWLTTDHPARPLPAEISVRLGDRRATMGLQG